MKIKIILNTATVILLVFAYVLFPKGNNYKSETALFTTYQQAGGTDWAAPKYVDKLKNPVASDPKSLKEGRILFNSNCATCHGDKGEGNGPAAAPLNPKPKNLTSKVVQDQTDGAIFWKITTGKAPMVSWQATLNEKQRWSLVNYIRELKKK